MRPALPLVALVAALAGPVAAGAAPARDGGRFVRYENFASQHVPPRQIVVWLPPGYDTGDDRYAVLYLHDGQQLFDPATATGHEAWEVDRHLAALERAHRVRKTIIVGIANDGARRWREYVPAAAVDALDDDLRARVTTAGGGPPASEAYLAFLVEELKPFIDARFRTRRGRADTFVMGSSMGGLISLYAVGRYPEVFGGAACLSTHWVLTTSPELLGPPPDPRLQRIAVAYIDWLRAHLPAPGHHRLYFDHGTESLDALYAPFQQQVDRLMTEGGYRTGSDFESRVFEGATHNERAWRERLDVPLRFLLRP